MQHFNTNDIQGFSKLYRLNLINSITGYKSANMIGTKSNSGQENVAIFSSITHLGSNPALLHFTLRPNTVPRDTYKNIKENYFFTVNHVSLGQIEQAHHTSAKYDENISEFDQTQLESEYRLDWHAPFVKSSPIGLMSVSQWIQHQRKRLRVNHCCHRTCFCWGSTSSSRRLGQIRIGRSCCHQWPWRICTASITKKAGICKTQWDR